MSSFRWRSVEERPSLDGQPIFRNSLGTSLLVLLGSNTYSVGIVLWNDSLKSFSSEYQSLKRVTHWMYPEDVLSLNDISEMFGVRHVPSLLDKICSDCSKHISPVTPIPEREVEMMNGEPIEYTSRYK
jgi:hypothetical protein